MNDLLRIKNLEKHYDGFDLHEVSLRVPAGSVVGFIGPNGAGKTTTIKSVLGVVRADAGSVSLFGEELEGAPERRLAQLKQNVGTVLDACSYPEELSVKAVGGLMAACYRTWRPERFRELTSAFKLPEKKTVKELSRGMGMSLSLACALAHEPDLLILDEATAGLDPLARENALETLRAFLGKEGRSILFSSHITSDLDKIADYVVCIDQGRIVFDEEKDAITERAGVAQCRAEEFEEVAHSGFFAPGAMRFERHAFSTAVLVPDRAAFAARFSRVALERASIESYMSLMLKGESR